MTLTLDQVDIVTRQAIRCPADELAARDGCRFDAERAEFVCQWIERYCRLYEGDHAGQPLALRDWQRLATEQLFGWVCHSEDWGRDVRRFRRASIWVPKKNGKSPSLAAWGLYLLAGDGEQGQKVYSVARDGKQAWISHTHAMEMVRRSPELASECKVNASTGHILHVPTSSVYKIVAGDNPQSQEGLNGSLCVDETHVVDRRLMKILKGAGISRSEPLHIEVSTAGRDPDGYGRERWEYGRQVAAGAVRDDGLLYLDYSAPQDLSAEDLDADPVKWGKQANPAWGRMIKEQEFLADYQTSKRTVSDLAEFKLYRLNIWQRASSPWIREADWARCRKDVTAESLQGQECVAGLDLSRRYDMSALVLAFDFEAEILLLPWFWLPEHRARQYADRYPFLAWADAGFLELTPGDVIDFGWIKSRFRSLSKLYRVRELAYDPRFAEEITQSLEQGEVDARGVTVAEGTGVTRVAFAQTFSNLAPPTADFERLVVAGKLRHNGHPVLAWQVGHAHLARQPDGKSLRPVKPAADHNDPRGVDGIVASLMALARLQVRQGAGFGGVEFW